jgi:hypothetical protein
MMKEAGNLSQVDDNGANTWPFRKVSTQLAKPTDDAALSWARRAWAAAAFGATLIAVT